MQIDRGNCFIEKFPSSTFTSMQITQDDRASLHQDSLNVGESVVFSCGKFTGGHLYEYTPDRGRIEDTYQSPLLTTGKDPHATKAFVGQRAPFVFFTHKIVK